MHRESNFENFGWFWDLHTRSLLELDPPYQRRSVWSQNYKDYFIDTVLNNYPCPAIFLFRDTSSEGVSKYGVVDGKQRLTTMIEFVGNVFPVPEIATNTSIRGKYFGDYALDDTTRFR